MAPTPEQIDAAFAAANKFITSSDSKGGPSLSNADKLQFYALFKQATQGPCTGKSSLDFLSRLSMLQKANNQAGCKSWLGRNTMLGRPSAA